MKVDECGHTEAMWSVRSSISQGVRRVNLGGRVLEAQRGASRLSGTILACKQTTWGGQQ